MKEFFTIDDFKLSGSSVLLRTDINSPIDPTSGRILNDARIRRHVRTINDLKDSKIVILAHQSRPGKADFTTTKPHAKRMSYLLRKRVKYVDGLYNSGTIKSIESMSNGDVVLLENVRFYAEEMVMKNQPVEKQGGTLFVRTLAPHFDYFIQDAFAAAHRSQPSMVGFSHVLPTMAGRVMEREMTMLDRLLQSKLDSKIAILGGLKVDDSIDIAGHFLDKKIMSNILTTGAVAVVFMMAKGIDVGSGSTDIVAKEVDDLQVQVDKAKGLLQKFGDKISMPTDVAVNDNGERVGMPIEMLPSEHPIYDIGLDTLVEYSSQIENADAAVLNGPPGVFEIADFSLGTKEVFTALAKTSGFSVIGGGHTIAAAEEMGIIEKFDHASTGGGALISYLCGEEMPAIEGIKDSYKKYSKA
jgi:phosphoglycerate kinase